MKEFEESRIRLLLEERKWAWNRFPKVMRLYLCLLRAALPEDEPYGEIMLRRGDVLLSLKEISLESGLSVSSIRTAIRKLTATADLVFSTYGNTRIIHINDYDLFMTDAEEGTGQAIDEKNSAPVSADKSGTQASDMPEAQKSHENDTASAGKRIGDNNAIAMTQQTLSSDVTSGRIADGTVGGYRGAYYSGETRVCDNTESLVKLCNLEKESVRKTINNTHSLNTHSSNPNNVARRAASGSVGTGGAAGGPDGDGSTCPRGLNAGSLPEESSPGTLGTVPAGPPSCGPRKDSTELFEEFWSAYPRQVNRLAARQAFARLNPNAETFAAILEALARQKESEAWHAEEGRYIPYPARWLSERRWEDDPAESARKFNTRQAYTPRKTVSAQDYEQRDYSEELETPEEMLARLQMGVGTAKQACSSRLSA